MIRIAMAFILVFNICIVFSQDTIYLDSNHDEVAKSDNYTRFKIVFKQNSDTIERIYSKEGKLNTENTYSSYFNKERNGLSQEWHENGTIQTQINYKDGNFDGQLNTFWINGKPRRKDLYKDGEFKTGVCFDSTGSEIPHFDYMVHPQFPGGVDTLLRYISENTKYPEIAQNDGIEGIIYMKFVITKTGDVGSTKVMRQVNPLLEEEALRVMKSMPRWTPGFVDGEPVNVWYIIPIKFKLQ